jgi:hypothetical protein
VNSRDVYLDVAASRLPPAVAADPAMRALVFALALVATPIAANAQTTEPPEPRSCQQLHTETDKCEAGMRSCDQRVVDRLLARCQRDQKRLPQVLEPREGGRP